MDTTLLKQSIAEVIKPNGRQEITGQLLQDVIFGVIDALNAGKQDAGAAEGIFIATYGETSFSEIQAAYNRGDFVICHLSLLGENRILPLTSIKGTRATFASIISAPDIYGIYAICTAGDNWASEEFSFVDTFYAAYGEATYQQVEYHGGELNQIVYTLYENKVYFLTDKGSPEDETKVFSSIVGNTIKHITLSTDNTWNINH